jgi:hypothetical protein
MPHLRQVQVSGEVMTVGGEQQDAVEMERVTLKTRTQPCKLPHSAIFLKSGPTEHNYQRFLTTRANDHLRLRLRGTIVRLRRPKVAISRAPDATPPDMSPQVGGTQSGRRLDPAAPPPASCQQLLVHGSLASADRAASGPGLRNAKYQVADESTAYRTERNNGYNHVSLLFGCCGKGACLQARAVLAADSK